MKTGKMRIAFLIGTLVLLCGCRKALQDKQPPTERTSLATRLRQPPADAEATVKLLPGGPTEQDYPHLHNLLQLTDRIYSGGEPASEQAFAELARLGVRTVVSVDGARPKVDAAKCHGLRYVHIPSGYGGISDEAGKSLARLVKEAEGPFYIHCHHGKHRGPAGAAIACIADGAADGARVLAVLKAAGTSRGYRGLWHDVESYTPPAEDEVLPELVQVGEVGSLAAAMAGVDRANDHLKLCEAVAWQTPPDHPDISPLQEALLLKEGFRETVRQLEMENDYDKQFLAWMDEAQRAAELLESVLKAGDQEAIAVAFGPMQDQCRRCHREYRD